MDTKIGDKIFPATFSQNHKLSNPKDISLSFSFSDSVGAITSNIVRTGGVRFNLPTSYRLKRIIYSAIATTTAGLLIPMTIMLGIRNGLKIDNVFSLAPVLGTGFSTSQEARFYSNQNLIKIESEGLYFNGNTNIDIDFGFYPNAGFAATTDSLNGRLLIILTPN